MMFTENYEQIMEAQKQQYEPMLKWNALAVQAFERIARKNYEVSGDMLDYMVAQSQIPLNGKPAQELVADFVDGNREFGEKLAQRSAEYVELTKSLTSEVSEKVAA